MDDPFEPSKVLSRNKVKERYGAAVFKAVRDLVAKYPGSPTTAPLDDHREEFIPDGALFADEPEEQEGA